MGPCRNYPGLSWHFHEISCLLQKKAAQNKIEAHPFPGQSRKLPLVVLYSPEQAAEKAGFTALEPPSLLKSRTEKSRNLKLTSGVKTLWGEKYSVKHPCNGEARLCGSIRQVYLRTARSATQDFRSLWRGSKLGYGVKIVVCAFQSRRGSEPEWELDVF